MIELSASAKKSLDEYLRQVRAYLRWSKTVDSGEVEQNITEHIENELGESRPPVSAEALNAVLSRLGRPWHWVPEEKLPWWRKVIMRLSNGPEDWRLAYISFGLLVGAGLLAYISLGLLVGTGWMANDARPFAVMPFAIVFFASFVAARAAVASADGEGGLGGRRWLVYPPLIISYAFVAGMALYGVTWFGSGLGQSLWRTEGVTDHVVIGKGAFLCIITAIVIGLWWIVLGVVIYLTPETVKGIFRPFADRCSRKWGGWLLGIGLVVVVVSTFVLAYMSGAVLV